MPALQSLGLLALKSLRASSAIRRLTISLRLLWWLLLLLLVFPLVWALCLVAVLWLAGSALSSLLPSWAAFSSAGAS